MPIIKCPECQTYVSDAASFCPGCGIRIANHIKPCANCGEAVFKHIQRCPHCGEQTDIALTAVNVPIVTEQDSYDSGVPTPVDAVEDVSKDALTPIATEIPAITSTDSVNSKLMPQDYLPSTQQVTQTPTQPTVAVASRRSYAMTFAVLFCLAICLCTGAGAYAYWHKASSQAAEAAAYAMLDDAHSPFTAYDAFLKTYPKSLHRHDVVQRYKILQQMQAAYVRLKDTHSAKAYANYLRIYPTGRYTDSVRATYYRLDWAQGAYQDTPQALAQYIKQQPQSPYLSQARQALLYHQSLKMAPHEADWIPDALDDFMRYLSSRDDDDQYLYQVASFPMQRFMGRAEVTAEEVVNYRHRQWADSTTISRLVDGPYTVYKSPLPEGGVYYFVAFKALQRTLYPNGQYSQRTLSCVARLGVGRKFFRFTLQTPNVGTTAAVPSASIVTP